MKWIRKLQKCIDGMGERITYENECSEHFGEEVEFVILAWPYYDFDEGKQLEPLPKPKVGDVVILELWCGWLGGMSPSDFRITARVSKGPDERGRFKAVTLCSYIRTAVRNDFYVFDSLSVRKKLLA